MCVYIYLYTVYMHIYPHVPRADETLLRDDMFMGSVRRRANDDKSAVRKAALQVQQTGQCPWRILKTCLCSWHCIMVELMVLQCLIHHFEVHCVVVRGIPTDHGRTSKHNSRYQFLQHVTPSTQTCPTSLAISLRKTSSQPALVH